MIQGIREDKDIQNLIQAEEQRQATGIELIASENYQSSAVLQAQASVFANKYAEGFPWKRYYWGQENTDKLETLAIERAKTIFHADHANVQALSGAAANLCFYTAAMEPWDHILGMGMDFWWHLTHGSPVTFISKVFKFHSYGTLPDGTIDFDQVRSLALKMKPKVILAGFSAYPRELDYARFAEIAKEVWAIAYADVSHIGGFIAAGLLKNPLDYGFHAMMTTTHKSLRGPRGALILSKGKVWNPLQKPESTIENLPTRIDRAVFPGMQWWPHMNTIAGIAVALGKVQTSDFQHYATQTLKNAQMMAQTFLSLGYKLVTGGTDNHMVILDFSQEPFNGAEIENVLDQIGISVSKSLIPHDPRPPFRPSGIRIGIAAMTTRGITENEVKKIVSFIDRAIHNRENPAALDALRQEVITFSKNFPLPH